MKCIYCQMLVSLDHDSSNIHALCWAIVNQYAQAWQHQMQNETHCIDKALFKKLERVAQCKKIWVWNLINAYLELAIAQEELLKRDSAVSVLEDVLARCIQKGVNHVPEQ